MNDANPLTCLILAPFENPHAEKTRQAIRQVLEHHGVRYSSLDDRLISSRPIAETIQTEIDIADFIIADLTGNNPNVMYELGYAHALGKAVLPIVSREQDHIPVDLRGFLYFVYDPAMSSNQMASLLSAWINRFMVDIRGGQDD